MNAALATARRHACDALYICGASLDARTLHAATNPANILSLVLGMMGGERLTPVAEIALNDLRLAIEPVVVAGGEVARMSAARREATTTECEWCNGDGHGAGPDACHHCDGAGRVQS